MPLSVSERRRLDGLLAELTAGAARWRDTAPASRAALVREVRRSVGDASAEWAYAASRMKRIPEGSSLEGEEWTSGPYGVITACGVLAESLDRLAEGRSPLDGETLGEAVGGRVTVRALPRDRSDELTLNGISAEVWLSPGTTAAGARATAGLGSRTPRDGGGVGLVLGAGNITSIPVLDVLYELIAGNRVVVLKLNPVMDALAPVFERALRPLIAADALRIVTGDGAVGGYLAQSDAVVHVHITGSITTHDAIVWGPGQEGERRRRSGTPLLPKPITSELGGVSPIIVVPGRWSRADLRFQAEAVATMRLHNGGCNCIAGQTVILSADWPQREAFLAELHEVFRTAPGRPYWYPGTAQKIERAERDYPDATRIGERLIVDVPRGGDPRAIETTEYFAPVLGIVELPGTDAEFLDAAVDRANDEFAGTLGVNVIADPRTIRRLGVRFERAVARLRYGAVAVNSWTGVAFLLPAATWGAYPGNRLDDVGSGIGVVHNALLIDRPEKTVVRGAFRPFPRSVARGEASLLPTPPWFVTARSAAETGRRLVEYELDPDARNLVGVLASAFRA